MFARFQCVHHGEQRGFGSVEIRVPVLFDAGLRRAEVLSPLLRSRVTEALRRDDVDMVILNHAPPVLRYEVLSAGCRLCVRDEDGADDFEHRSLMRYLDTAHLRATQQRLLREARR